MRKVKKVGKFIKNSFIPHEKNHHKPHILHEVTLLAVIGLGLFLMGISFARYHFLHGTVKGQEVVASVLIDLTNETRIKYGESPLKKSSTLELASSYKADDMATYEYFSHNSPSGKTPWYWLKLAGYDFLYAGENLAIDFTESKDVTDAWMKSPTHKANLLNSKFTEIGISTKQGMIDGHNTIYVVQMFGTRKVALQNTVDTPKVTVIPTAEATTSTSSVQIGEVAGAEIEVDTATKTLLAQNKVATPTPKNTDTSSEEYVTLVNENNMLIVADKDALQNATHSELAKDFVLEKPVHYSSPWQRLVYNFWYGLNTFYKVVVTMIMISMAFFLFAEFKRKHWLHMVYGVITILILLSLLYLNQRLW